MTSALKVFSISLLALGLARMALAGPGFELVLDGPDEVNGAPGARVSIPLRALIVTNGIAAGEPGAQGWSLSIAAPGWDITDVTTDGTVAAEVDAGGLRNTGFDATGLTTAAEPGSDCDTIAGGNGAYSAIVLSLTMPITLDPGDSPHHVLNLTVEGGAPASLDDPCLECEVLFADGCQSPGVPVNNNVTLGGNTVLPALGSHTTRVCPPPPICLEIPGTASVIIQDASVFQVSEVAAGLLTAQAEDTAEVLVEVDPGAAGSGTVYAAIVSNGLSSGIQGWQLALSVSGEGHLTGVTSDGTAAAEVTGGGLRNNGFEQTQLVDPSVPFPPGHPLEGQPQGEGAISAVVLSLLMPITLAPTGTATVLCMTVESAGPVEEGTDQVVDVRWLDGMRGLGQPVNNVATVSGETVDYCTCQSGAVTFRAVPPRGFLRCDPNIDGKTDIADSIWVINELFRGGPATTCPDSADCDDSGLVDLTDATYSIAYQFLGGAPPPPPFPECAQDPTEDKLGDCVYECP